MTTPFVRRKQQLLSADEQHDALVRILFVVALAATSDFALVGAAAVMKTSASEQPLPNPSPLFAYRSDCGSPSGYSLQALDTSWKLSDGWCADHEANARVITARSESQVTSVANQRSSLNCGSLR